MIGPVGRRSVIVLTAGALALAAGCEEQPKIVRGYGSHQLLHVRDTSFSFYARTQDHVYFRTGGDDLGGGRDQLSAVDLTTGTINVLGATMPDLAPPVSPPGRYACEYRALADGTTRALSITDTQTDIETVIEGVYTTRPFCPRDDDVNIHAWLKDSEGLLTLWRGPYTELQQATLPVLVRGAAAYSGGDWLTQAAWPEAPAAFGLYWLHETELTVSEIVAPVVTSAAWAEGATPVGSLSLGQHGATVLLAARR